MRKFDCGLTVWGSLCIQWLQVPEQVKFKLVLMVLNCLHHKAPQYLNRVLRFDLWCGQSTTSSACQALLARCALTVSARMGVWHLLLPAQLPGTHWAMICMIQRLPLTVSDVCLKLGCFQSTSRYSTFCRSREKGLSVYIAGLAEN